MDGMACWLGTWESCQKASSEMHDGGCSIWLAAHIATRDCSKTPGVGARGLRVMRLLCRS